MSVDFYPIRLRYSPNLSERWATYDGVSVRLRKAPSLPGLDDLVEIDYAPRIVAIVRVGPSAIRDMTPDEQSHALMLLQNMAGAARGVAP